MQYKGGKNQAGTFQRIINQMPPHRVYIEPFLGSGAILRLKRPAERTIGIDADADAIARVRADLAVSGDAFRKVELIHGDALAYFQATLDNPILCAADTLIYADPPYLMQARSSQKKLYRHEFGTIEQHRALLTLLKRLSCSIAISGYASDLYFEELRDWRHICFDVRTRGGRWATEYLWMNYPEPDALHDYRYLGENYRERELIAKQKRRWTARLRRMNTLQRYALMHALEEFRDPTAN